jgi:hypothetical protein
MKLALAQRYDKYYNTPYQRMYFYDLFIFHVTINVSIRGVQTGVGSGWRLSALVAYLHIKMVDSWRNVNFALLRFAYLQTNGTEDGNMKNLSGFCNSLIIIYISSMCPKWTMEKALIRCFLPSISVLFASSEALVCII